MTERERLEHLIRECGNYAAIGRTAAWPPEYRLETLVDGYEWLARELRTMEREMTKEREDDATH